MRVLLKFGPVVLLCGSLVCLAQSTSPSGATGKCRDGTYTTSPQRSGACSAHKGVQTWYTGQNGNGADTAGNKNGNSGAPSANRKAGDSAHPAGDAADAGKTAGRSTAGSGSSAGSKEAKSSTQPVAGSPEKSGGPGMVWVNTASKVYHCYGSADYGKTKQGQYASEQQATQMGARPANGKSCSK